MRDFFFRLIDILRPTPPLYGGDAGRRARERRFVMRRARGNVSLQCGSYWDAEAYARKKAEVCRHDFGTL